VLLYEQVFSPKCYLVALSGHHHQINLDFLGILGIGGNYFEGVELDDRAIRFTSRSPDVSCPDQTTFSNNGIFYYSKTPIDTRSIIMY